ncbi:C39 family peptidase [Lactococcus taiwanensis]|jgi:uncharacterized protein YvpB|uniref:C39 family peptidase n=1 Tax=Lactococcus taiwanensis TaxID=1151742 RepID=A0AA45QRD5_9LACT|nr:C39 family peptidase [Lactococcus taiwanensis]KZK36818.1 glucosyltransferase-S [Lactococcus cremoris]QSE76858.1 C39 family peptidase [Lactococcus taiwanensis]
MINKKKRRLKKKNLLFALFVISVLCFLVWAVVHHFQKDETSVTPASKITSKSDSKGREDYVLMDTGDVNQIKIGAYQGCETVSLYNALVYLGQTHGKSAEDLIDELTLVGWGGDPNSGYAGNPWTPDNEIPDGGFPTIWPTALMAFAQQNGVSVIDLSGKSMDEIKAAVLKEHLVEMWVTIDFATPNITYTNYYGHRVVTNTHAVLLDGYDASKGEFHVNDPIKGKYWLSEATVASIYTGTNQFAIEFLK